jgi:hypothetical protein
MSSECVAGRGFSVVFLALTFLTLEAAGSPPGLLAGEGANDSGSARLALAAHRYPLARAIRGAAEQLADERCEALLDEFADGAGRPLRSVLSGYGLGVSEYMSQVFFYDAPESACHGANLILTTPGSRVVFVCGARFQREMWRNPRNAEAVVIHELLHTLGLGENPPSSDEITARVRARCGQRRGLARGEGHD